MLVPLGLFYAALWALGPTGAICAALAWNYLALARRIWRRERLPGVLLIATLGLTARSVLALASGNSLFVYFLQPSLATALLGGAFLLSVPLGRPLAEKLAHDFVPLPAWFVTRPRVHKLFVRISLLWALVSLANAAGTIALLVNVPITTYLAGKDGPVCLPHIGRDRGVVLVVPPGHPPLRAGPRTGASDPGRLGLFPPPRQAGQARTGVGHHHRRERGDEAGGRLGPGADLPQ